jgi:hypothetical protein
LIGAASGARDDAPLKTQTFTDPRVDNQGDAADVTGASVENSADGTLGFTVRVPTLTRLTSRDSVAVFFDVDQNRETGQGGSDYAIVMSPTLSASP